MVIEAIDIIVAPTKPIYDPEKLNQFIDSLVPNIPRSSRDRASGGDKETDFSLGKLYFDETLGTTEKDINITTTATEPEALKRAGVHIGKSRKTEKESHRRRTWVRVYPNIDSAKIMADYERGIKNGTVEHNRTFDYMKHRFSPEQFNKVKKIGVLKRPKLLGGK